MKFYFFGRKLKIPKGYIVIVLLILVIFFTLWGGYLNLSRIRVFHAVDKPFSESIQERLTRKKDENLEPEFININTDGVDKLVLLNGIGEVKANAIIEYRQTQGPFQEIEDIKNVKGIGEATFLKIKDSIIVATECSDNL